MTDRKDLDGVWVVLETTRPSSGVLVAPTGYDVAAGQILAGVDSEGKRHLLIPLMPGEPAKTNLKGRAVHVGRLSHDGAQYLTIVCLLGNLNHVFTQFCRELAASAEKAASPAREAAEAFERWKDLFSNAVAQNVLSEESLVGLLGELLVLDELLKAGCCSEIDYWVGPHKQIHDFRTLSHAIEVKATLVREGRVVAISGVDQLQEPPGADLYLRHVRMEPDPAGFCLGQLVERVLSSGASRDALRRALNEHGLLLDDLASYRAKKYRVVEERTYDVLDQAFPRIVRTSFLDGDLPVGTLRLTYFVDLTNEPPMPLSDESAAAVIAAFANEAS